ncbi:TPA: hypothetical protein OME38_004548 [Klebsiella oxytoca]|nr:hypothetical protein [Klebsiella oxytoca]
MTSSLPQREQILDQEIRLMKARLMAAGGGSAAGLQGGLIFTGNIHDTVPRQLLLSGDIGPREKICWQLIRLYAPGNRAAVFPSYTELQYQLAAAEKERASRDAVSQAIRILRMERWLSLVDTVRLRDKKTGRLIACRNIYALHDEPLPFEDAEQLDPSYMALLEKCVSDKNSKAIRHVADRQLRRIQQDTSMRHQHSRAALIASRLAGRQTPADAVPESVRAGISPAHIPDSHSPYSGLRQNDDILYSKARSPDCGLRADDPATDRSPGSTAHAKSLKKSAVRDPDTYVRRSFSENKKNTYVYPGQEPENPLPTPLAERLSVTDREQVIKMCHLAEPGDVTQILREACRQIGSRQLRNPCGWVLKMLQQARQGNWNPPAPQASPQHSARAAPPVPGPLPVQAQDTAPQPPVTVSRREQVRQLLAQMNARGNQPADRRPA